MVMQFFDVCIWCELRWITSAAAAAASLHSNIFQIENYFTFDAKLVHWMDRQLQLISNSVRWNHSTIFHKMLWYRFASQNGQPTMLGIALRIFSSSLWNAFAFYMNSIDFEFSHSVKWPSHPREMVKRAPLWISSVWEQHFSIYINILVFDTCSPINADLYIKLLFIFITVFSDGSANQLHFTICIGWKLRQKIHKDFFVANRSEYWYCEKWNSKPMPLFNDTVRIIERERVGRQCNRTCSTQCSSRVACHGLNCEIIHIEILRLQENAFRKNIPCDCTSYKPMSYTYTFFFLHTRAMTSSSRIFGENWANKILW